MSKWNSYLEKTGGMPFLEQDRPAKVKEIYSALKRDHPGMPAEKKARIAARQGKKGKQKQGPPYKGPLTKTSSASLDLALGALYQEFGPPLEKHASVQYFYEVSKDQLDRQALGASFCKLAAQSGIDPWDQALYVVHRLDELEQMAKTAGTAGELARFYLDWAGETEKHAGLNLLIRGGRAAKAGLSALAPSSVKMRKAVQAAGAGKAIPQAQTAGQAVKGSLQQTKALQQAGGGSIRRGERLVAQDPGLMRATQRPVMHPGRPPEMAGGGLPRPQPRPAAAPAEVPTQVVTQPAAAAPTRVARPGAAATGDEPTRFFGMTRNELTGAGLLGGAGLGAGALMGAGGGQQQQYAGGY